MTKKMFSYGLLLLAVFIPFIGYAANNKPVKTQKEVVISTNPERYKSKLEIEIDDIEKECIENNPTQGGMNSCVGKSLEAWDKALNDIYGKLINRLDKKNKLLLKNAQREWTKYRDNHYKFLDAYYNKLEGSMYVGMHIKDEISIVRDRTLELNSLLELMDITDNK